MIYLLHNDAGKERLLLKGETHKYLVKVLRYQIDDVLQLRTKNDIKILHTYKITDISPKNIEMSLIESQELIVEPVKKLHIAWCVIDTKSIEKVLPTLNEIGVSKISFIYCDRSQKNFRLDFKRFERILEASMQQSGRTHFMEFEIAKSITTFIAEFPDTKVFDFTQNILKGNSNFQRVLIGCEGGFSNAEKELLQSQEVFRLNTPMVLRSESAVVAVSSKILL